jgi:site-specific DNA recombinase
MRTIPDCCTSQSRFALPSAAGVPRSSAAAGGTPYARTAALIAALREAQGLLGRDTRGLPVLDAVPDSSYKRRLLRLAFLAPDLQRSILEGRQPPGLTLADLMAIELPLGWADQHKAIAAAVG